LKLNTKDIKQSEILSLFKCLLHSNLNTEKNLVKYLLLLIESLITSIKFHDIFKVTDKSDHHTDRAVNDCCRLNKDLFASKTFSQFEDHSSCSYKTQQLIQ